jgi:hypothetical protein
MEEITLRYGFHIFLLLSDLYVRFWWDLRAVDVANQRDFIPMASKDPDGIEISKATHIESYISSFDNGFLNWIWIISWPVELLLINPSGLSGAISDHFVLFDLVVDRYGWYRLVPGPNTRRRSDLCKDL